MRPLAADPDLRSLLLDTASALYEAHWSIRALVCTCIYLCGGVGEPRDIHAEQGIIGLVLFGLAPPAMLDRLYDWHPVHAELVEQLRASVCPYDSLLAGALRIPRPLKRALIALADTLDAREASAAMLRLEALQRQRRALAATLRALRELRSLGGDQATARAHLADAIRQLEAES